MTRIDKTSISHSRLHQNQLSQNNDTLYFTQLLHPYTETSTDAFCYRLIRVFRESRLSKTEHRKFLDLIHYGLAVPNNLPSNMNKLVSLVEMTANLFRKRRVCLICTNDINNDLRFCPVRPDSNDSNIAFIYDSGYQIYFVIIVKKIIERKFGDIKIKFGQTMIH